MRKKSRFWRYLYKAHRYAGLSSALVLLMLAVTGIALNHTEQLKLDSQMIHSPTLLDWYHIKSSFFLTSYPTSNHWITLTNQQLYFNQTPLIKSTQQLMGAVETDNFIVIALNKSLLLVSLKGELIEQNTFQSIENIGLDSQNNIVIKNNGITLFSHDDLISWLPLETLNNVILSKKSILPDPLAKDIKQLTRHSILPLERVILDIHSGRFFGLFGVIIIDISGIMLILLALSGCIIWMKHTFRSLTKRQ